MNKVLTIITGAGQGIGKHLAKELIKDCDLILISKTINCKKLSNNLNKKKLNKASYVIIDFNKKINIEKILNKINMNNYTNINLIFAAGYVENFNYKLDIHEWKKVFNINIFAHLEILNYLMPLLKKFKKESKVIFFSGGGAANDFSQFPAYSASKTAIVRTVENLSIKFKKFNIVFFAVAPGAIKTNMLKKVLKYSTVKTRTSLDEIFSFINYYIKNSAIKLNGRLIHIRDNKNKINKNVKDNYLKLRRVE